MPGMSQDCDGDGVVRRVTIRGGHRDGETIDWCGREMRAPAVVPYRPLLLEDDLTVVDFAVDRYVAERDADGRWWYVLQP